jgi:hypothetical protein
VGSTHSRRACRASPRWPSHTPPQRHGQGLGEGRLWWGGIWVRLPALKAGEDLGRDPALKAGWARALAPFTTGINSFAECRKHSAKP